MGARDLVLFWVFVAFFVVIGILAILAILGVIRTDRKFRKWALGGFVVGVVGVVFMWARSELPVYCIVNLRPPLGVDSQSFYLVSGQYSYLESDQSTPSSGSVELTASQDRGLWSAKFPPRGMDKAVSLTFKDKGGKDWEVPPFYPNVNNKELVPAQAHNVTPTTSLPGSILGNVAFASTKEQLKFNNYAKPIGEQQGKRYFKWRVFVDEPRDVLDRIALVQYLLHPTFPQPLQVTNNPNDKFAVEATGWGSFLIQITIKFKDQTTMRTSYMLDLSKGWP